MTSHWRRRLVTCPLTLLLFVLWWTVSPVLYVVAALVDLVRPGSWTNIRCVAFIACWLLAEAYGILFLSMAGAFRLPGYEGRIYRVQSRWMRLMLGAFCRIWSVRITVEGLEHAVSGPLHVLCRHASLIDTVIVGNLIANPHGLRFRYIFKKELLFDPTIDIYGNYVPNMFVDRRSDNPDAEVEAIGQLGTDCGPIEGVVLYPEGTLFSEEKRQKILKTLADRKDPLLDRAAALRHVLPPRLGGALALLDTKTDILFCAHAGLDGAPYIADYLSGKVTGRQVKVALWRVPTTEIPTEREAQVVWLYEQWTQMDRWVEKALAELATNNVQQTPAT